MEDKEQARMRRDLRYETMLKERVGSGKPKSRDKSSVSGLQAGATQASVRSTSRASSPSSSTKSIQPVILDTKPKQYKSASHFMATHFPSFDSEERADGHGPMRAVQLMECNRIKECLQKNDVFISDAVLERALVIPQDRPETFCKENLREDREGLMENPLPKEYWRDTATDKKKKKKKKKRKDNSKKG